MNVTLIIQRYNPESDGDPYDQPFTIEAKPTDRVLDALMYIKRHVDGTLSFRKSCGHGVCGSDAMRINGKECLACKTLIKDVTDESSSTIEIRPLRSMRVERDLMVDQKTFFERFKTVSPYLIAKEDPPEQEYHQTQEERAAFDDPTSCILCGACYSACPVLDEDNPDFVGPAAIAQAARFSFDSRDVGVSARVQALDHPNGVWACENHFNCTRVCPRGIKITKNINFMKRAITKHKEAND